MSLRQFHRRLRGNRMIGEHHKPENQISDNETTGGNEEQEIKEKEDKPVPVEAKPYKVLSAEDKMKHFKTHYGRNCNGSFAEKQCTA